MLNSCGNFLSDEDNGQELSDTSPRRAEKRFKIIGEAYNVLIDAEKKVKFDQESDC